MKTNFLVSNCYNLWLSAAKSYFAVDSYILHVIEREGLKEKYKDFQVAPLRRTNRQKLQADHDYVDKKFRKYTRLIIKRLDVIHNVKYGSQFWGKSLSLALLRHVAMCYELFQVCEQNFDKELHDCQILNPDSYHIPITFDEHRHFLQYTDFGQEQLFSIYCNLFYSKQFSTIKFKYSETVSASPKGFIHRIKGSGLYKKIFRRILMWLASIRQPTVGIMGSYFSTIYINQLILKSRGKIQLVQLPAIKPMSSKIRMDLREVLTQFEPDFDRFDKFIFSSLQYLMPKSFVENFLQIDREYKFYLSKYRHLKWVVCENWIGHEATSIALALLKQKGVNHISNEHNYLSHPFLGNSLKYQIPLVDEFVTLGWRNSSYPNLVPGASLFEWKYEAKNTEKEHDILFIMGRSAFRRPEMNAAYGTAEGYGAQSFIELTRIFLESLGENTLGKTYVRAYPKNSQVNFKVWDQTVPLKYLFEKSKIYDDTGIEPGRSLINKSRLVVVNYLSTSHLESIISDIPTVFIWDKDTMMHDENYVSIYDELIESGICQTNAKEAANFINMIKDNPEAWWYSHKVRKSIKSFLNENIGKPEFFVNYLLNKSEV